MKLGNCLAAEFIGTGWLVFCGCGSAVMAISSPASGVGILGVSLAFGFSVLTMAYAIGHVSGCHLNPAVTIGLALGGRFRANWTPQYIVAQLGGGIAGAAVLYFIASGKPGFSAAAGFASNGYGEHSPGGYSMRAGFFSEIITTFMFMFIVLGATDKRAPAGFAPLAISLGLVLIILASIPVTNTSLNPARSTATAVFEGGWALRQLWMFWLCPIIGAALAGLSYRFIAAETAQPRVPE